MFWCKKEKVITISSNKWNSIWKLNDKWKEKDFNINLFYRSPNCTMFQVAREIYWTVWKGWTLSICQQHVWVHTDWWYPLRLWSNENETLFITVSKFSHTPTTTTKEKKKTIINNILFHFQCRYQIFYQSSVSGYGLL